jgi:hypothetical protein
MLSGTYCLVDNKSLVSFPNLQEVKNIRYFILSKVSVFTYFYPFNDAPVYPIRTVAFEILNHFVMSGIVKSGLVSSAQVLDKS